MKIKHLLFFGVLLGGLLLTPVFVLDKVNAATDTNSTEIEILNKEIAVKKDKIKQLEETIEKYNKEIEQKRTEAISLKNQLNILDTHLEKIEADIELTQNQIAEANLQISALQISILEKETVIARQKIIIAKMVQDIHAEDQKNYVEIMLTNKSFADFFNQVKYLENVYTDLGRSAKTLRLAKEELENKKNQLETKKKTLEKLKNDLENKRKDLSEQTFSKQTLLAQTHGQELQYRTLLSSLKQQYQAVEGEVKNYEDQVRKKLSAQDKIDDNSSGQLFWPVVSHYITSYFHDPDYPYRRVFEHSGIDIRASQGAAVRAASSGYVAQAKRCSSASCYSYVLIIHSNTISTLYGHLSSIAVANDQFVGKGDVIGYSGGTPGTVGAGPFVTGPHLHFEVRQNGIPTNPLNFLVQ